jgi:hypothetical protein
VTDKQATSAPDPARVREQRQRSRSIAIALALGALSILFYAATIVRMGGNVANRPLTILLMPVWSAAR